MIDYEGFRAYLVRLGFADNGINTYVTSYLHENKIDILNNFEKYKTLTDEQKIIKFSKEDKTFEEKFNQYHSYSKEYTFSDVISGARRYVLFIKYKAILKSLNKYKDNKEPFLVNEPYWFFKIFDDTEIYPVKAICRDSINALGLSIDFHTENAKSVLNNIFNFKNNKHNLVFVNTKEGNDTEEKENKKMEQPLNQILYGPPGTGKTYNTIDKALQIIDGSVSEDREEAKERFEELKEAGQIEFVTFHQSYGYEEFVEGIKADVDSDDIRYSIEDGIFKRLSRVAEKNYLNSRKSTHTVKDFDVVFKEKILNKLEIDNLKVNTPQKYFYVTDVNDRTIFFEKASGNRGHTLSIRSLKKMYEIGRNDFLVGGLSVYYQPLLELLLDEAETIVEPEELKNYILIIDEINRGNISKIFGELITLIEESKRLGNVEAMEVTLPYSGEKFGVPNNLYIIGTMNTADRSIALMDTALRRRFEFEEMMPNPELLTEVEGIDLKVLLSKINQRIEYLYDRDHTIGHAYFMDVRDKPSLDSAMRNKVIPLLQEYFYDDWEKIRLVLNDGFVSKIEQKPNDIFDSIDDELVDEEKYGYGIEAEFPIDAYRKIYE